MLACVDACLRAWMHACVSAWMDDGAGERLAKVRSILTRLASDAEERRAKVLVTLQAEPEARYQRIMDVMNCLAKAKIVDVTFAVGGDD